MKKFTPIFLLLLLAVSLSLVVSSCGKPADPEIMAAEDAIKNAVTAGAEDSSPKLLEKARGLIQEAKMLNEQGKYGEARKKAENALLSAEKAQKNSERIGASDKEGGAPDTTATAAPAPTEDK